MVSRPIIFSFLLAASTIRGGVATDPSPRPLRGSSIADTSATTGSEGVPDMTDIADTRRARFLQENATNSDSNATAEGDSATVEEEVTNTIEEDATTIEVPEDCFELLLDAANEYGKLKKDDYFVFTDGMSNGWYTFHNMTSYGDLPMTNKHAFVTLTCRCKAVGEREDCCQGDRAKIDLFGMDDPETMTREMRLHVNEICSVTSSSIGENRLPATSRPTTARPTTSAPMIAPTVSIPPTEGPTTPAPSLGPVDAIVLEIPVDCLNLLSATANENGKLFQENYFVFTDGMSNGYYTANNMAQFNDLPVENKFAYVTLTCQCHGMGGRGNCCQGPRAKLDVAGIDEPETMSMQLQRYVNDICSVTSEVIGDNKLPPSGELPTTYQPTSVAPTLSPVSSPPTVAPSAAPTTASPTTIPTSPPTASSSDGPTTAPTASPVVVVPPQLVTPPGGDGDGGGLGTAARVGIAAAAAMLALLLFCLCFALGRYSRNKSKKLADEHGVKGMDEKVHGGRDSSSPGTANSIVTASDVGSLVPSSPNPHRSGPYSAGSNLLLPEIRGEESMLLAPGDRAAGALVDPAGIEEGVAVRSPGAMIHTPNVSTLATSNVSRKNLATRNDSSGRNDLDQAVASGS